MEKDLNKAAAEGYRLLGTWYSGQLVSILQKVNASPSASEYRCLDASDIPALEKKLKEAAAEGFRFVPRTLTQMSHLRGGTVGQIRLVVERGTGSSQRYDYFATAARQPEDAVRLAVGSGYTLVGMMTWSVGGSYVLIGEKTAPGAAAGSERVPTPMSAERYRLVAGPPGANLQAQLSAAAVAGYRVVLTSTDSLPLVLIMEKTGDPSSPFEYLVISGADAPSMGSQLNAAAAKGFRAYPAIFAQPAVALMERAPGSQGEHEYRFLERMIRMSFGKDFTQVTSQGWTPVGVSHGGDMLLFEKAR